MDLEKLANTLWDSRTQSQPCRPITEIAPEITLDQAYRISEFNYKRRVSQPGIRPAGKKIGLTSLAVQKQLGVGEPDFGYLTSDMHIKDGGILPRGSLMQGKAEAEVAFVLKKDLKGPGIRPDDVISATDYVVACIEIIDSRVKDWKIKIQDTVADNASSAFFVLGNDRRRPDQIDLRMAGMLLKKNGELESTGVGAACLDHPFNAVAWLANAMGQYGESLKAGDVILSGAYGPVTPFVEGDQCEIEINGLGKVSCRYETRSR